MEDRTLQAITTRWSHLPLDQGDGVNIVSSFTDLLKLGALRYKRFVEDQGQPYHSSEGMHNCLIDPIDYLSVNFVIRRAGIIALALRLSWWLDICSDDYLYPFTVAARNIVPINQTIVCSRLVSTNELSDLPKLVLMFRQAYETAVLSGARYAMLSTLAFRAPLFERFGFRDTGLILQDPIAGPQHIMLLDMANVRYLTDIGSPLAKRAHQLVGRGMTASQTSAATTST